MGKVLLLTKTQEPYEQLPTPYDQLQYARCGTILGKEIYMGNNILKAVKARIGNAKKTNGVN